MAIFLIFSPTSTHLHPLQVENCDSNSRHVVDEDGNGKLRLEMVKTSTCRLWPHKYQHRYITNVRTRALWALNARQFAHLSCILLTSSQCNISPSTYVFFILLYLQLLFICSILGTIFYGYFFSFHLLHMAEFNQLLKRVMQAVTKNGMYSKVCSFCYH